MILLLIALCQAAPAAGTLEGVAASYADGDDSARPALLRAGADAVLPLRKARDRAPKRIDPLLFEVKAAAGGASCAEAAKSLRALRTIEFSDASVREALQQLGGRIPLLYDPTFKDEVLSRHFSLLRYRVPGWEILDEVVRTVGVDWGFVYGKALVSSPERLWPSGPTPPTEPLDRSVAARAAKSLEELESDVPGERAAAFDRLRDLGAAAIPLLEEGAARKEAEVSARCRELLAHARGARSVAVFRAPAAESQRLQGADAELRRSLQERTVTFQSSYQPLDAFFQFGFGSPRLAVDLGSSIGADRVFTDFVDEPAWTVLALICHACGCDFILRDGKVFIDGRSAIEKRLAGK
jgi:hypothetical protein